MSLHLGAAFGGGLSCRHSSRLRSCCYCDYGRLWSLGGSPSEESVWVIPFLRLVEIEAVQPAFFRFCGIHWLRKAVQERRRTGDSHVCQQARNEEGYAPVGPPDVGLRAGELPWRKLAEHNIRVFGPGQDAIADDPGCVAAIPFGKLRAGLAA